MAWSGLGSGTISDPYQITTQSHLGEMGIGSSYSASDYFLLMNDVCTGTQWHDASLFALYLYSNLDGSSHKITMPAGRTNPYTNPAVNLYRSNTTVKNIKFEFPDIPPYYIFVPQATLSNITLDNIQVKVNSFYWSNAGNNILYGFSSDCPSTWTINNLYLEGPFTRIFGNVACSLDNINVVLTVPSPGAVSSFFLQNFTGYDTHIKNCSLKFPSLFLNNCGAIFSNITGTRNTIEQCYVEGEIQGYGAGALGGYTKPDTIIKNCYFNGSLIDYSEGINTFSCNFTRDYDASLINNYAYIKTLRKELYHSFNSSTYFQDLGFTDWYIPSRDEMSLVISNAGTVYSRNKYATPGGALNGYMTSSEVPATASSNFYAFNYTYAGVPATKVAANTFYSLILIRNFSYDINDEPRLGQPYLGGYCIKKDNSTLTGMMCGPQWVAEGAKLFDYGSTGSVLNTSTGVGSGITNTALMAAAATTNQAATKWNNTYSYPTFPGFSFYPISAFWAASHKNNYCAVSSKESNITISSYAGQEYMTDASMRDVSTYVNWDFATIWEQEVSGRLPVLRDNPNDPYIGLHSYSKTTPQNLRVNLNYFNTDLISSEASAGLIAEIYKGSEIYDASGLIHNISLPDASDFHLVLKPYYLSGGSQVPVYSRDYYFYPYDICTYIYPQIIENKTLNVATYGVDVKLVHGALLWNGYVFGCSRQDPIICKIKADDYSSFSYVNYGGPGGGTDQIIHCNGFIWALKGNLLIRIDPSTLSFKTGLLRGIITDGTNPIASSHDRYLYCIGIQYADKYDSSCFLGPDISTYCPDSSIGNALLGTYDSYSQGQWLIYNPTNPLYQGSSKGACHSTITDGNDLYIAYTTKYGSFGDNSGYNVSTGLSVHEVHRINIDDMASVGYANIPKSTDDMDQDLEYIYTGCEVQFLANPSTLGFGASQIAIRKSDMKVFMLSRTEIPNANPPLQQSYGVYRKGKTLIDLRTSGNMVITSALDPSLWSLSTPASKYNIDIMSTAVGATNEILMDYNRIFHVFVWNISGGTPYPSNLFKVRFPSHLELTDVPMVMTLDGSVTN